MRTEKTLCLIIVIFQMRCLTTQIYVIWMLVTRLITSSLIKYRNRASIGNH